MIRSFIRRLARDERGVSAVEFALIAPIMFVFYAAMADLCQGYMAFRRVSHTASAVADLVSQSRTITKGDIDNIFDVGPLILSPFAPASMEQRVASVTRVTSTKYQLDWSRSWAAPGTADRTLNAPLDIAGAEIPPALLTVNGASIIVSETAYTYKSPFQAFLPEVKFLRRAYLAPREATVIPCSDC
ncbi:MAG: pilus assembly protein [Brevundimonas sp.]|uniref:TadE/TadG family type IV pilus assembly protein n=1 Tax=Brevundimonas sp. TaxID=1871086 RepID=UPI0027286B4F|nr:TadE/TadG family type IV pilus assembly protein [Brevundimonas sp.]MDO9608879.1 pilus assembly protein [Brevundimonas sp.]